MIKIKIKVTDYIKDVNDAIKDWQCLENIQYLYEHGEIVKYDTYIEARTFETVFIVHWKLPLVKETYFYLKWPNKTFME